MSSQLHPGDPIKGEIHSADASSGVQITIYKRGLPTAYTLKAHECIVIHEIELVTATGGDSSVFLSTSSTPATGGYIVRGTYAANGGVAEQNMDRMGTPGQVPWVIAPSGAVDVVFSGTIVDGQTEGLRPTWREKLNG